LARAWLVVEGDPGCAGDGARGGPGFSR